LLHILTKFEKPIKLLIVEDNEGDYVIIEDLLIDNFINVEVVRANSFAQSQTILASERDVNVVVLDLTLPDEHGESLVLKVLEIAKNVPVIVLTGYSDKDFGIRSLTLGVADYLLKDELNGMQLYKSISYSIERKRIFNDLAKSEQKYKSLFELSPIPMWVYDAETYQFLKVNKAAIKNYGYSELEFLSMGLKDIRPQEDLVKLDQATIKSRLNERKYYKGNFRHIKKNGDIIFVEIESNRIAFNGPEAVLVLANDVTEKLIAEDNLKNSEAELEALNAELESRVIQRTKDLTEAYRQLESFSFSISHDLQAPLRTIIDFMKILKDKTKDTISDDLKTCVDYVINSSCKMSSLITNLLDFSRLGKVNVQNVQIQTMDLVVQVWQNLVHQHSEKTEFVLNKLPDVQGDALMIEQVFVNLISNAIKYSSKKDRPLIEVGTRTINGEVSFYVKDNGAGFDMAYYRTLFGIFTRLHDSNEFDGTGVGLSIVKRIIEKHGGRIWAESKVNEGATFSFTLPLA